MPKALDKCRLTTVCLLSSCLAFGGSPAQSAEREWRFYGGDPGGMRFSPLKQINRTNVARLQRVWTYRTGELSLGLAESRGSQPTAFECTQLVVDGVLYLSTPSSRVIALDAETGKQLWKYDPQAEAGGKRKFR